MAVQDFGGTSESMLTMCKQTRAFVDTLTESDAKWALGSVMAHLIIREHHNSNIDIGDVFTTLCIASGNPMLHLYTAKSDNPDLEF